MAAARQSLTRLLAAGLLALLLPVMTASSASACSCADIDIAESVAGADAVFLAVAGPADELRVTEVFAGMMPSRPRVRDADPCTSGLVAGQRYVVLATLDDRREHYLTRPCSGTTRATPELVAAVEELAGPGRPPSWSARTG